MYDGVRAQFPLSFGKQSKPQTPLEAIHNKTLRSSTTTSTNDLPSLSSSSKAWLTSLRNPKSSTNDDSLGPPRPPLDNSNPNHDDDVVVGPPRPSAAQLVSADEEEEMIGPPMPPPGLNVGDSDSDSDSEEEEEEEEEKENRYRIPLSNEIVLKGHSKV